MKDVYQHWEDISTVAFGAESCAVILFKNGKSKEWSYQNFGVKYPHCQADVKTQLSRGITEESRKLVS